MRLNLSKKLDRAQIEKNIVARFPGSNGFEWQDMGDVWRLKFSTTAEAKDVLKSLENLENVEKKETQVFLEIKDNTVIEKKNEQAIKGAELILQGVEQIESVWLGELSNAKQEAVALANNCDKRLDEFAETHNKNVKELDNKLKEQQAEIAELKKKLASVQDLDAKVAAINSATAKADAAERKITNALGKLKEALI